MTDTLEDPVRVLVAGTRLVLSFKGIWVSTCAATTEDLRAALTAFGFYRVSQHVFEMGELPRCGQFEIRIDDIDPVTLHSRIEARGLKYDVIISADAMTQILAPPPAGPVH
jgi:hypothetical protein